MKTITLINWIIIGIYAVYAIFIYIDTNKPGMDAAGRGMAMGFLLIGLIYLALLIGLNLINVKWVRILVLLLGGIPIILFGFRIIADQQTQTRYAKQAKDYSQFKDPHLNEMKQAIAQNDFDGLSELISKDKSLINQVGSANQRTILDLALDNAFRSENPNAIPMVHLVLENGADPNIFHPKSYAPLAKYGLYCDVSIFEGLLKSGADPNVLGEHLIPFVYKLIESGRDDIYSKMELLLKHGLDANLSMGDGQPYQLNYSPLVWSAHHEQWKVCDLLIDHGADMDFQPKGPDGRTFWFILKEKDNEYKESGTSNEEFEKLLTSEAIKNQLGG